MTKECRNCGAQLEDEARFCKSCGESVSYYTSQPIANQQFDENPADEKSYTAHLVIGIVGGMIIPLIGIIMGIYLYTRKDEKAKKYGQIVFLAALFFWVLWYLSSMWI